MKRRKRMTRRIMTLLLALMLAAGSLTGAYAQSVDDLSAVSGPEQEAAKAAGSEEAVSAESVSGSMSADAADVSAAADRGEPAASEEQEQPGGGESAYSGGTARSSADTANAQAAGLPAKEAGVVSEGTEEQPAGENASGVSGGQTAEEMLTDESTGNMAEETAQAQGESETGAYAAEPEAEKSDAGKSEAEQPETEKSDAERPEAEEPETEKSETGQPETEKSEAEKPDPELNDPEKKDPVPVKIEEEQAAFSAFRIVDGVKVTVSAPEGVFPGGTELRVRRVSDSAVLGEIGSAVEEAKTGEKNTAASYAFDIKAVYEGEEIQPDTSAGSVSIRFSMGRKQLPEMLEAGVYHLTEEEGIFAAEQLEASTERRSAGQAEETGARQAAAADEAARPGNDMLLNAQGAEDEAAGGAGNGAGEEITGLADEGSEMVITVETDSFSYYVVEFFYDSLEYVLAGDSSVLLSRILEALGISGEVSRVRVSDESLLGVQKGPEAAGGPDWKITALQPFDTEEWMEVTADGFLYRITVTDSNDTWSVTFDYGSKLTWQEGDYWYYITSEGWLDSAVSESSALSNAVQSFTIEVTKGDSLGIYPPYPNNAVEIGGVMKKMTGWTGDNSVKLSMNGVYDYHPAADVTFSADWEANLYRIDFIYNKVVWEKEGKYYYIDSSGWESNTSSEAEAQANAVDKLTYYVVQGKNIAQTPGTPSGIVSIGGQDKLASSWAGDNGETISLGDVYNYKPQKDISFTLNYSADLVTVTFDYGWKIYWPEDDYYVYISPDGWTWSAGDEAGAQANARQTVTRTVVRGDVVGLSLPYPPSAVTYQGGLKMMTGWKADDGTELDPGITYTYRPQQNITFHAQYSADIVHLSFDYARKPIWERNGMYVYIDAQGNQNYTSSASYAQARAMQQFDFYILKGDPVGRTIGTPEAPVTAGGQQLMASGWRPGSGDAVPVDSLRSYIPAGDTVFTLQWTEQYHTVTVDLGGAIVWPGHDIFHYFMEGGVIGNASTADDAAALAVSSFKLYVLPGNSIGKNFDMPVTPVTIGGQQKIFTGWSAGGKEIAKNSLRSYRPASSMTIDARWTASYHRVTFDYGVLPVWGQDDVFYYMWEPDAIDYAFDRTNAEYYATRKFDYFVADGDRLGKSFAYPTVPLDIGGQQKVISGWSSGSETLNLEVRSYKPTKDVTFTAQWTTDFVKVTFDFGDKLVWEEDNGDIYRYSYVSNKGNIAGVTDTSSRSFAESEGSRIVEIYAAKNKPLCREIGNPLVAIPVGGESKKMTGWQGSDNTRLDVDWKEDYIGDEKLIWDYVPTAAVTFTALWGDQPTPPQPVISYTPMYRLYNPYSYEHFYTANEEEKNHLDAIGWNYEGIAWYAPTDVGDPVYRLYNPYSSDHHYTTSAEERDNCVAVGWIYEGIGWLSATTPDRIGLHRLFNPYNLTGAGTHHYTNSDEEKNHLVSLGWVYEGLAWFGLNL